MLYWPIIIQDPIYSYYRQMTSKYTSSTWWCDLSHSHSVFRRNAGIGVKCQHEIIRCLKAFMNNKVRAGLSHWIHTYRHMWKLLLMSLSLSARSESHADVSRGNPAPRPVNQSKRPAHDGRCCQTVVCHLYPGTSRRHVSVWSWSQNLF